MIDHMSVDTLVNDLLEKHSIMDLQSSSVSDKVKLIQRLVESYEIKDLTRNVLGEYHNKYNQDEQILIKFGLAYTLIGLGDKKRNDGTSFMNHNLRIAKDILEKHHPDWDERGLRGRRIKPSTLITAIVHDTIEEKVDDYITSLRKGDNRDESELEDSEKEHYIIEAERERERLLRQFKRFYGMFISSVISKDEMDNRKQNALDIMGQSARMFKVMTRIKFRTYFGYVYNMFDDHHNGLELGELPEVLIAKCFDRADNTLYPRIYSPAEGNDNLYLWINRLYNSYKNIYFLSSIKTYLRAEAHQPRGATERVRLAYQHLIDTTRDGIEKVQEEIINQHGEESPDKMGLSLRQRLPYYKRAARIYDKRFNGFAGPTTDKQLPITPWNSHLLYYRPLKGFNRTMERYTGIVYDLIEKVKIDWPLKQVLKDTVSFGYMLDKLKRDPSYIPVFRIWKRDVKYYDGNNVKGE